MLSATTTGEVIVGLIVAIVVAIFSAIVSPLVVKRWLRNQENESKALVADAVRQVKPDLETGNGKSIGKYAPEIAHGQEAILELLKEHGLEIKRLFAENSDFRFTENEIREMLARLGDAFNDHPIEANEDRKRFEEHRKEDHG